MIPAETRSPTVDLRNPFAAAQPFDRFLGPALERRLPPRCLACCDQRWACPVPGLGRPDIIRTLFRPSQAPRRGRERNPLSRPLEKLPRSGFRSQPGQSLNEKGWRRSERPVGAQNSTKTSNRQGLLASPWFAHELE